MRTITTTTAVVTYLRSTRTTPSGRKAKPVVMTPASSLNAQYGMPGAS